MANITETAQWEPSIYRIETTDPVIGGEDGISNIQAKLLGNRTLYLKEVADNHEESIETLSSSLSTVSGEVGSIKGTATLVRHGIIVAKRQSGSLTAKPNFLSLNVVTKTVTLVASGTEPFAASIQAGFGANPLIVYVHTTANKDVTYSVGTEKLLLIQKTGTFNDSSFSLLLEEWVAPVFSFIEPTSPVTGMYWYDLKTHQTFRYDGVWNSANRLPIAKIIPGDEQIVYLAPIGKSVDTMYGICDVPAGTVHAFAGSVGSIPAGYLLCDGGAVNRSFYCNLFDAIGTTYGVGNGSTTFNLPDLRGEFIRGLDGGRGIDTDTMVLNGTRTNASITITGIQDTTGLSVGMSVTGTGIAVGATIASIVSNTSITLSAAATASGTSALTFSRSRTLGSSQADMFKQHFHLLKKNNYSQGSGAGFFGMDDSGTDGSENTEPRGGYETRPRNIAMNYIIKF